MSNIIPAPSYVFLEKLVPGSSLKQGRVLCKAVRIWAILRMLYDHYPEILPHPFTYQEWHSVAIDQCHILSGVFHDKPYQLPLSFWLFELGEIDSFSWKKRYCQKNRMPMEQLDPLLQRLKPFVRADSTSDAYYIRKIRNDIYRLVELKCLQEMPLTAQIRVSRGIKGRGKLYQIYSELPSHLIDKDLDPSTNTTRLTYADILPSADLAEVFSTYLAPINGTQRFFLDLEYVVAWQLGDRISRWQSILREQVWSKDVVPPVRLIYVSASQHQTTFELVIYPVCIIYSRRALYLSAFGQTPDAQDLSWFNYRLDWVKSLELLHWDDFKSSEGIKGQLLNYFKDNKLPQPEQVFHMMELAWGFDFFRPSKNMLLSFDRIFHDDYILGSERHQTFIPIHSTQEVRDYITNNSLSKQDATFIWTYIGHHPKEALYTSSYRRDDNNLIMRLRAWCPKVAILSPPQLRNRIRQDAYETWQNHQGVCRE